MAKTQKEFSERDFQQVLRAAFSDEASTIAVDGFIVGKVGRKITRAVSTTTVANDTETFDYSEDGLSLFQIKVVYTDGTREDLISVERVA